MSRIFNLLSVPFIAIVSIPLLSFAAFTTSLAFAALLIRVSVVYVELAGVLLQSVISPSSSKPEALPFPPRSPVRETPKPRHHRRSSASSTTPSTSSFGKRNASFASLVGTGPSRDYEGVGGWRLTSGQDEDEEATWMGMNSRLELPALAIPSPLNKKHRRSLTGGSQRSMVYEGSSPEMVRSPSFVRNTGRLSGTASPEGYFGAFGTVGCGMTLVGSPSAITSARPSADGGFKSEANSRRASIGSKSASVSFVKLQGLT